jgi:hypothetical protein
MRADDDEFNALLGQYGQHVEEVAVHRSGQS